MSRPRASRSSPFSRAWSPGSTGQSCCCKGVDFMMDRRLQGGSPPAGGMGLGCRPRWARAAEERPPNIVLDPGGRPRLERSDLRRRGSRRRQCSDAAHRFHRGRGVNFVNGYAANGTCAPSRAAIMSGRYGTRFGFEFTPDAARHGDAGWAHGERERHATPASRCPGQPAARAFPIDEMGMPASEISLGGAAEDGRGTTRRTSGSGTWVARTAWRPKTRASTRAC